MFMFDAMIDQDKPIARVLSMFRKDCMPHALLFTGIEGIGKRMAALGLAMALNCSASNTAKASPEHDADISALFPCGHCRSCHKISTGVHPDILSIGPTGNLIKILQIRDLCARLLIKPNEALTRLVIIDEAHSMNAESANALLKSLEEPPKNTMFILITSRAPDLLPTILSRCQEISFNPVSEAGIEAFLIGRGRDSQQAAVLASMADGSIGKALSLSKTQGRGGGMMPDRQWISNEIEALGNGALMPGLLFAEKLSTKKEYAVQCLEFMTSLIRDLVIYKFSPDKILNRDLEPSIARISNRFPIPNLLSMNAHIQRAHKDIQANAALRLSLEIMAFNLSRV